MKIEVEYCSFCGKYRKYVYKLVAGKDMLKNMIIAICDECVQVCQEAIEHSEEKENEQ